MAKKCSSGFDLYEMASFIIIKLILKEIYNIIMIIKSKSKGKQMLGQLLSIFLSCQFLCCSTKSHWGIHFKNGFKLTSFFGEIFIKFIITII